MKLHSHTHNTVRGEGTLRCTTVTAATAILIAYSLPLSAFITFATGAEAHEVLAKVLY